MQAPSVDVQIRAAAPNEQPAALNLLLSDYPAERRGEIAHSLLSQPPPGSRPWDGLAVAFRQDHMVGAVWVQVMHGNSAVLWPPRCNELDTPETGRALIRWADEFALKGRISISQAALPVGDSSDTQLLSECGYHHLTDLNYIVCQRDSLAHSAPEGPLVFQQFTTSERGRMEAIVDRTYVETLDCPALNGVRSVSDVLDGYLHTGVFSEDRWFFVRHLNADVGCLLLADHPEHDQWELIYMGLLPTARGNGWGKQIAQFGQWRTRCAGRSKLVLAVDVNNSPGYRTYQSVGFRNWQQRRVWLKEHAIGK